MADCEWNPADNRPAFNSDPPHAKATVRVGGAPGTYSNWWLCAGCAALPVFGHRRTRRPFDRCHSTRRKLMANRERRFRSGTLGIPSSREEAERRARERARV